MQMKYRCRSETSINGVYFRLPFVVTGDNSKKRQNLGRRPLNTWAIGAPSIVFFLCFCKTLTFASFDQESLFLSAETSSEIAGKVYI